MARRSATGEGTIYLRKDGRWEAAIYVDVASGMRKRVRVYGKTRAEVHDKLVDAKSQIRSGLPFADTDPTLAQYLDNWLAEVVKPAKRPATYQQCERVVRLYLKPSLGSYRLKQLTVPIVQAFLNAKIADGCTLPLLQVIKKVLSSALTNAMREERVTRNVARLAILPTYYTPERGEPWSAQEAGSFLRSAIDEPLYAAFVLLLFYGMRRGEVLGLTWDSLDFARGTIRVRQQLQRADGKLELSPLKTKASRRPLPLLGFVETALAKHKRAQATVGKPDTDSLVFTSSTGGPLEPSTLIRAFRKACIRSGVRPIRVHDTRHSLATLLKELHVPVRDAQLILGHARVTTTQELYQHDRAENRRRSLEAVEAVLVGQQKGDEPEAHRLGESDRCRQYCRQVGFIVGKITSSIFGAGQGALTPGLVLGKSFPPLSRVRLTEVNLAWQGRRRQHLLGLVAVNAAVNAGA
jgi:integrase